ncbi:MAG: HEAT repeat domain-containing protein [Endomicrobiales bacterium]
MGNRAVVVFLVSFILGTGWCFGDPVSDAARKLGNRDRAVVIAAVRDLARLPSADSTRALSSRLKTEKDNYIKVQIIEALALHQSSAALEAVLGALDDPSPQVRQSAMINLGYFSDQGKTIPVIERALAKEESPEVSLSAVNTLKAYKSDRAVEAIDTVLSNKNANKEVRVGAARSLGKIGSKEAKETLSKYVNDADKDVQDTINKELGRKVNTGKSTTRRSNKNR